MNTDRGTSALLYLNLLSETNSWLDNQRNEVSLTNIIQSHNLESVHTIINTFNMLFKDRHLLFRAQVLQKTKTLCINHACVMWQTLWNREKKDQKMALTWAPCPSLCLHAAQPRESCYSPHQHRRQTGREEGRGEGRVCLSVRVCIWKRVGRDEQTQKDLSFPTSLLLLLLLLSSLVLDFPNRWLILLLHSPPAPLCHQSLSAALPRRASPLQTGRSGNSDITAHF